MPTFLRRRYYRKLEEVPGSEKALGVALLLLLGGIVAAFVLQATGDKHHLFDLDEAALRGDDEPRALAVARQMVPALGSGAWPPTVVGWRDVGPAEAIQAGDLSAALGADTTTFQRFDTQWVYRRRFETVEPPRRRLTILVCDVASPEQAFGLTHARRPEAAAPLSVGRDGWMAGDKRSAGFWNGRYYTELRASDDLSGTTLALRSAAAAIAAGQLSYGRSLQADRGVTERDSPGHTETVANPFPDPAVRGWHPPRQVSRFTPDNLYEKINGRAALYLQFHVSGLTFGTYFHRSDPDRTIDVYWFDMDASVDAFGIYRAEAPPEPTHVSLGREGYQVAGALFFCKGSSYVQILPGGEDEADARVALEIAGQIAERIKKGDENPWAAAILPEGGRVANSLNYIASDAFGLGFLKDVFTADYNTDRGRITLFVHRADSAGAGVALLDEYAAFFQHYGTTLWTDPDATRPIIAGEVAGVIDVVFAKGRYLAGVTGAEDLPAARAAAVSFYDELTEE